VWVPEFGGGLAGECDKEAWDMDWGWFFFFFFLNPSLLSFEAGPHVRLYIRLYYSSWPLMPGFASTSLAVLSFCAELTLGDHSPRRTSTETLFSDAP
jgi:hypothetical protein